MYLSHFVSFYLKACWDFDWILLMNLGKIVSTNPGERNISTFTSVFFNFSSVLWLSVHTSDTSFWICLYAFVFQLLLKM